jgi:sec-independent protein translocase protein TatC
MIVYRPSINDYIDSLTNLVLGCGLAFELPVFTWVLARLGIVSSAFLRKQFKYAVVIILVVAAVITPSPDWTSQFIVALPLTLLYFISILIAGRVDRQRAKDEAQTWR